MAIHMGANGGGVVMVFRFAFERGQNGFGRRIMGAQNRPLHMFIQIWVNAAQTINNFRRAITKLIADNTARNPH